MKKNKQMVNPAVNSVPGYDIPTHDPQTGEQNPYYEELTGHKHPTQEEVIEFNRKV